MSPRVATVLRTLALASGLGLLAYVVVNPLVALLLFFGTVLGRALLPALARSRLSPYVAGLAIGQALMPYSIFVFLNYLRPDLMQSMLDHVFGSLMIGVVGVLAFGGGGAFVLATSFIRSFRGLVVLSIARAVLCTLPAILLVLFGPIVFAFMFGNMEGK